LIETDAIELRDDVALVVAQLAESGDGIALGRLPAAAQRNGVTA
jgi:hypothetical protein